MLKTKEALKVTYSLLKEIDNGNIPSSEDYGISKSDFYEIVDNCVSEGLLSNITISRAGLNGKVMLCYMSNAKLSIKGMEYLKNKSDIMKTYKGLKELREWMPF